MSVLVIRHGLSEANNYENIGSLAFAAETAPLMELGREQARTMGGLLVREYGVVPAQTRVAVSKLLRSPQTAIEAGFEELHLYDHLDEVKHGMDLLELKAMLKRGELPDIARVSAQAVLDNPPAEGVWVSHGLCIAGLCAILDVHQDRRLIPEFCEIRELPI